MGLIYKPGCAQTDTEFRGNRKQRHRAAETRTQFHLMKCGSRSMLKGGWPE